jgi:hypothetical protein
MLKSSEGELLYRTERAYDARGAAVSETDERWQSWPGGGVPEFDRRTITRSVGNDGRPLREVWLVQFVYGFTPNGTSASAGIADFSYDAAGRLVSTTNTRWSGPERTGPIVAQTTYLTDPAGKILVVNGIGPFADYIAPISLYSTGLLKSYSVGGFGSGKAWRSSQLYDEQGRLSELTSTETQRFGPLITRSAKYEYDGGRIVTVDGDGLVPPRSSGSIMGTVFFVDVSNIYVDSPIGGHTVYRYDDAGNNVGRVTTDGSGNIIAQYLGVYDSASNLVCEKQTFGGRDVFVIPYDYRCF